MVKKDVLEVLLLSIVRYGNTSIKLFYSDIIKYLQTEAFDFTQDPDSYLSQYEKLHFNFHQLTAKRNKAITI